MIMIWKRSINAIILTKYFVASLVFFRLRNPKKRVAMKDPEVDTLD